jgi:hypothetical protein
MNGFVDPENRSSIVRICGGFNPPLPPCVLGYPTGVKPALSSVIFDENEILRKFAPDFAGPGDTIKVWYNDEHPITLGVRQVNVITTVGKVKVTTTTNYTVDGSAVPPFIGTTAATGDQAGTDLATYNKNYNYVDHGRPMWPALFITDTTADPTNKSGDWQQGGVSTTPPSRFFGTWKAAVRTVDYTKLTNGHPTVTVEPDNADGVKNHWTLGGGSDIPPGGFALLKDEGYGSEIVWNVDDLGLTTGHVYRVQVMVHDGDNNGTGGDAGEGCLVVAH